MQSINIVVINPWFLTAFFGTAAACLLATIWSLAQWHAAASPYFLAGSVLYLVGTFLVTMRFNVPRNNALARAAPASPEAAGLWGAYLSEWTAWNHVRTVAAFAAAVSFVIAASVRT